MILSFKEQLNFHSRPSFIIAWQIYFIYFTNSFRWSLVDDTFCIAAAAVMLYFWIRIVSMVRARPLRWCKSTLPRFSESFVFETCVPLTYDGIYNSKFTQCLLIHFSPHLTYFGFSPHHFRLLSCTEYRAEEPYFFCNDRYLKVVYYSILYSNAHWYFPQVLSN